jgi:hypothetical protein
MIKGHSRKLRDLPMEPETTSMPTWTKVLAVAIMGVCLIAVAVLAIGISLR